MASSDSLARALILARGVKGAALVNVLLRAIRDPAVIHLAELLDVPAVDELRTSAPDVVRLLELFAYGTYAQFKACPSDFPNMDAQMLNKLKQLSLVTIAESRKSLPYAALQAELDLASATDVEGVVISCVNVGLVQATLDQRNLVVEVKWGCARDVHPEQLDGLVAKLQRMSAATGKAMDALAAQTARLQRSGQVTQEQQAEIVKKVSEVRPQVESELRAQYHRGRTGGERTEAGTADDAGGVSGRRKIQRRGKS